ncbi:MAG: cation transporter [bacterium]
MTTKVFKIEGMSCHHCVMAVNKELAKLELIDKRVQMGSAVVDFDELKITEKQISDAIGEAGYKVVQ